MIIALLISRLKGSLLELSDITFVSHRRALIELCMRNALRYLRGEISMNHDLRLQIEYVAKEGNTLQRDVLKDFEHIWGKLE